MIINYNLTIIENIEDGLVNAYETNYNPEAIVMSLKTYRKLLEEVKENSIVNVSDFKTYRGLKVLHETGASNNEILLLNEKDLEEHRKAMRKVREMLRTLKILDWNERL